MKIAIVHSVSGESAKFLKEYLVEAGHKVDIHRPHESGRLHYYEYDHVINLGCSAPIEGPRGAITNRPAAVRLCIDKRMTFAVMEKYKLHTLEWTTDFNKVPDRWGQVAVRKDACGRKAEDLEWYLLPLEKHLVPRDAALYTRCFYGRFEYRIVVLRGKVVGRYYKSLKPNGDWEMKLQSAHGFEMIDRDVTRAALYLGIDYAGFDVIAKNKKDFAILEANSGATITHEAAVEFVNLLS